MKILFLTQTYPRFEDDTAGPFIRDIARSLVAAGDEVHVLAPYHPSIDPDNVASRGIRFHSYRYAPTPGLCQLGYSQTLHADVKMRKIAWVLGPAMVVSARRKLDALLRAHDFDCLNAHWLVPNGILSVGPARKRRVPLVVSEHGSGAFVAEKIHLFGMLTRRALARVDGVTSCSPDFFKRSFYQSLAPDAVRRTIPYGVDTAKFTPAGNDRKRYRDELGLPQDSVLVFAVGRMVYKKGFEFLLRAAAISARCRTPYTVVLGGDGDLMKDLRGLAGSLGIADRVLFPGLIYREALPKFYRAADIFAMPCVRDWQGNVDGLPNVILEGMASGLPVVASDISGVPLAVRHRETGILVPPGDPESLAAALDELAVSGALRDNMGRKGRLRVEQELTWERVAAEYRAVYVEAAARFRRARPSPSRKPSA